MGKGDFYFITYRFPSNCLRESSFRSAKNLLLQPQFLGRNCSAISCPAIAMQTTDRRTLKRVGKINGCFHYFVWSIHSFSLFCQQDSFIFCLISWLLEVFFGMILYLVTIAVLIDRKPGICKVCEI